MKTDKNIMITCASGKIRGVEQNGIKVFKGIPYAAPPVGANRFAPPQPVKPWQGVFEAFEYGPIAPQPPSPPEISRLDLPVDEAGCLTLNIWTPGLDNKKRPVMVWIHGGSLKIGSGAEYDGAKLAARGDVVVVTINYRLGIFGFLYVPGKTANVGVLDQVAALQWVKQNISKFGGDAANVTVFGESAGAHSISVLMSVPRAKGLFKRAILQSGGCSSLYHNSKGGETVGRQVFTDLGIPYGDMEALRSLPAEVLQSAYQQVEMKTSPFDFFPPFIDGDTIPEHPLEAIGHGAGAEIEVLAGFNSNEASLFSLWDPGLDNLTPEGFRQRVSFMLMMAFPRIEQKMYNQFFDLYTQNPHQKSRQSWEDFFTDLMFRVPIMRFLDIVSRREPNTYAYEFAWKTPEYGGVLGTPHALDLYFIFDMLAEKPYGIFPARSPETDNLTGVIMDAWLSFARTGNPNHKNLPAWSRYETGTRKMMVLDNEPREESGRYRQRDGSWQDIL